MSHLIVWQTNKVAMNNAHTFDALLYCHIGFSACWIICLLMAIVIVVTFWYCGLRNNVWPREDKRSILTAVVDASMLCNAAKIESC
jgi:uncharacterized SAM-binding protein YcdF (DUF218 family)